MKLVALLPCYNVETFCLATLEGLLEYADHIIAIDDGSTDGTGQKLQTFAETHQEKIHLITFSENQGKGIALLEGMKEALKKFEFNALVTIDSDGQHSPLDIPEFARLIESGADLVIGSRKFKLMPFKNKIANKIISFLLSLTFPKTPVDTQSGYRAFRPELVKKIVEKIQGTGYEMEFQCILLALCEKANIVEHKIATIYLNKNLSSHFLKFRDTTRIFFVLWNYWLFKTI